MIKFISKIIKLIFILIISIIVFLQNESKLLTTSLINFYFYFLYFVAQICILELR